MDWSSAIVLTTSQLKLGQEILAFLKTCPNEYVGITAIAFNIGCSRDRIYDHIMPVVNAFPFVYKKWVGLMYIDPTHPNYVSLDPRNEMPSLDAIIRHTTAKFPSAKVEAHNQPWQMVINLPHTSVKEFGHSYNDLVARVWGKLPTILQQ